MITGMVLENHGALLDVMVDGRVIRCILRDKLKQGKKIKSSPVAAGDKVEITLLEPTRGVTEKVLERASDFSRAAVGSIPLQQTLVANVDQVLIIFAAAEPRPDYFLLDRFLVLTLAASIERIICINKIDLVDTKSLEATLTCIARW